MVLLFLNFFNVSCDSPRVPLDLKTVSTVVAVVQLLNRVPPL